MGDVDPVLPNDQYPMLELYNLRTDMSEQNNLVETQPEKTQALLKLLNSPEAHTEEARYPLTKEERLMMASQK